MRTADEEKMSTYQFTIVASGLNPVADDFEDRFYEAGCGDATLSFQKGKIVLEFTREARSLAHALVSAIRSVRAAGATVEHIEPDQLVTLSDIADRAGISRAAVSLFASGERGARFPAPIARLTTRSPMWDWVHVAKWLFSRRQVSRQAVVEARVVQAAALALNNSLALRAVSLAQFAQPRASSRNSRLAEAMCGRYGLADKQRTRRGRGRSRKGFAKSLADHGSPTRLSANNIRLLNQEFIP